MQASYPHNLIFNDIIFEGRNKAYGAYFLRQLHDRNMSLAIFISIGIIILLVNIPELIRLCKGHLSEASITTDTTQVILQPPPITAVIHPPVAKTSQTQPATTVAVHVAPTVRPDDLVENEILPPSNVDLENIETGLENIEGESSGINEGNADDTRSITVEEKPAITSKPFTFVEQMPEFQGGYAELILYLQKHLKYPVVARENGITGKVIVQFVVTAEGKIKEAKVVRGIGGGCDQEALRVVKGMPVWKPGMHNGMAVPVTFTLPISFELK